MRGQGRKEGSQFAGHQFTGGAESLRGAELLWGAPKSPHNVTSTFFNTVSLLSKELRFDHVGAGSTTGAPNSFFAPTPSNLVTPLSGGLDIQKIDKNATDLL